MLVSTAVAGAAASARAGAEMADLAVRRTPSLVALGTRATVRTGHDAAWAQVAFRDELLTLLDDAAEIAWRQARRARSQLGARTSSPWGGIRVTPAEHRASAHSGDPRRRHRVKA
jgi:hypothetical protein